MFNSTLEIIIKARDEASQVMSGLQGKLKGMEPAFRKMAVAGTAAFIGVAAVAKKSIDAYAEVERANRQLETAVLRVSKGTREQLNEINSITEALEKKAGIDSDSLKMGAAQLSTFGLQSASVVKLTKSLADLTVNQSGLNATSEDYISNANVIAKALNGQFGALERSGIRFTEAQQQLILFGSETEKVAALQEGLNQNLRETTDTVGGLDLAQAKLKRTMEGIQENIGKALSPAMAKLAETVQPIIEKFSAWAQANPELLSKLILIGGALVGIVAAVGTLGLILPTIIAGFTLLAGPVGIILGIIAALTFAITKLVGIFTILRDHSGEIMLGLKIMFKESIDAIVSFFDPLVKVVEKVMNTIERIGTGMRNVAKSVGSKISDVFSFRAQGGNVSGGSSYVVGERGPEVFTPGAGGYITPTNKIGGGTTTIVNINGGQYLSREAALDMGDKILDALQIQMRGA